MKQKLLKTLVHISDLHFAECDRSSGDSELQHHPPSWDQWHLFDGFLGHHYSALRQFESTFRDLQSKQDVTLIVTGDLTASAHYDRVGTENQFYIANQYLQNEFQIDSLAPLGLGLGEADATRFAIPGNHDHWGGNILSSQLPNTIFGGPTVGFYFAFRSTPFVGDPIQLTDDCWLRIMGIDSDADTSEWHRLFARGEFQSQLVKLANLWKERKEPRRSQIRVLLMHHSPMFRSSNSYGDLEITSESREALRRFVIEHDIAMVLTGHIHLPNVSLRQTQSGVSVLGFEARCGTSFARDEVPPGWKTPRTPHYELPNNTFLVHRLHEVVDDVGHRRIDWKTNCWLRSQVGFEEQETGSGTARVTVWPRARKQEGTPAARTRLAAKKATRGELCTIWEKFARSPNNRMARERAQLRRDEIIAHILTCDICSNVNMNSLRNRTYITNFLGADRRTSTEEISQIEEMRVAAAADEAKAVKNLYILLGQVPGRENPLQPPKELTDLQAVNAIEAVRMLAARVAGKIDNPAVPLYVHSEGTISGGNLEIAKDVVLQEISLIASTTTENASTAMKWIWTVANAKSNIFAGFICQPQLAAEDRVLLTPKRTRFAKPGGVI